MADGETTTLTLAAAVITDAAARTLLVRKAGTSAFMQPGGKIEIGETPRSALKRELREELGLAIEEDEPRLLGSFSAPAANEPNTRVTATLFALVFEGTVDPGAEIVEIRWLARDDVDGLDLAPLTRDHVLGRLWSDWPTISNGSSVRR